MASGNTKLGFAIRAVNEANKALKEVTDDLGKVEKSAKNADGALSKMGSAMGDMAKIAGGFVLAQGIMKAPGFFMDAAKAAAEDEQATARLDQALRNVGGAFDENKRKVEERISAGQKLAFSDDQVRDSFQTLLAATGDVDEALRRQALAMDFARGAGIPLEQASKLLGKVTSENVEAFKRMGITIGEGATEAEAFAVIQEKFAGQSETYAKSTAGQFEILKIRMAEAKETIGAALLPAMTAIGNVLMTDVIPKIESFAAAVGPTLKQIADFIQRDVMPVVKAEFAKFQVYYESDIAPAIENIKTAIESVVTFLKEHWGKIEPFVRPIFIAIETYVKTLQNTIKIILDLIQGDWEGAWNGIKDQAKLIFDAIIGLGNAFKDQALAIFTGLRDLIMGVDWWQVGADIMKWLGQGLRDLAGSVLSIAGDIAGKIGEKLNPKNWIGSPMGIQNWFPYYMEQGLTNMARVVATHPAIAFVGRVISEGLAGPLAEVGGAVIPVRTIGRPQIGGPGTEQFGPAGEYMAKDPSGGWYDTRIFGRPGSYGIEAWNYAVGQHWTPGSGKEAPRSPSIEAAINAQSTPWTITVNVQGGVYGVDEMVRVIDQAAKRAGLAGLA